MTQIYLSIVDNGGIYKHWSLFIDGHSKIILQAKGSDGRFRYEPERIDPRGLSGLIELVPLFEVDEGAKVDIVKALACQVRVRSDVHGWNCQDWVLGCLDKLEEKGVVDGEDMEYKERKKYVMGKVEGLVEV
ncbi:hypothetical protein BDV29DRAFT_170078 [Aspergillus leporis]|jgi:hypothetical protein|uniref:Uncharacterized protein n=1 Tax=Aspergillus leporis TaxID=41062 RepID=A0A5N5XAZ6_9EURO|nr:hypothetical protein BDV29DRAFT_170078 [Aspergillus leporis]